MCIFWGFFLILSCLVGSGCTGKPMPCEDSSQCQYFIQGSECLQNVCECPSELLLSSDGSRCLEKVKEYGSGCEDNVQCAQELSAGGVCEEGTCRCKTGYHYLKGFCWKDSSLHEKCLSDEHCFSSYEYIGLRCENQVCKCRENYYERLTFGCRRKRRLNESCNLDKDCVDGSVCDGANCSKGEKRSKIPEAFPEEVFGERTARLNCPKGTFESNGECVLELGMGCTSDSECNHIGNAFCLDGLCGCEPAKYVASDSNRECLKAARGKVEDITRTSCKKDAQCGVFGGNSVCRNRRCACKDGSYWEKNNALCWPVKKLGETCDSNLDCNPLETLADCTQNKCECKPGFHSKELICVPDAVEVGDSCDVDSDCWFPNSFCNSSQVCQCQQHFYPEKGKCVNGVETRCDTNTDCAHLLNTECKTGNLTEKQCLCLEDHSSSDDYKYCLPDINFKGECSESFQCRLHLGGLGKCIDGICQCPKSTHYAHGKCYLSKFLGERCSRLSECLPGNDTNSIICLKGYCTCNYDYQPTEAGICLKTNSGTAFKFNSILILSSVIFLSLKR